MLSVCIAENLENYSLNQWSYVLSHFSVDRLFIIGNTSQLIHKPFSNIISIKDASFLPKDSELVLLTPREGRYFQGKVSLKEFKHPNNAIYFFGPNHTHLSEIEIPEETIINHSVFIETDTKDEMFSHVAAALTLYDRRLKNG